MQPWQDPELDLIGDQTVAAAAYTPEGGNPDRDGHDDAAGSVVFPPRGGWAR